ncbi:hypothetical protein [Bacillus safensis]|uniref:hypothetical protein n=1 Tax=Bacillus safensis TaxID=561879 RepID=UPI002FFEB7E3
MFTKHELVTICEALDELHPGTRAQFEGGIEVRISELKCKVVRLINESESTISEDQAMKILALDPVNLRPSQYEIEELGKARKILESRINKRKGVR